MKLLYFIPLLLLTAVPAFAHIGFQPVYQPTTPSTGGEPVEKYCDLGDFFNSYNDTTHIFTCITGGGGGENNTASNLTPGEGLFYQKIGVDLQFKGLLSGGNLTITSNNTSVILTGPSSTGEANTMSSPTHANSLVLSKSGVDLPIKGIACGGSIICSSNNTDITLNYTSSASALLNSISGVAGNLLYSFSNTTGNFATATIKNPLLDGLNHTDTEAVTVTRGDLIVGTSASLWGELPIGASGTVLKSDGTDPSWGSITGGVTLISGNVTFGNTAAWGTAFQIPLTANSGNNISGVLVAASNTAGGAVQAGANMSSSNAAGWCLFETPTAATADTIDFFALATTVTDTAETTWAPAANVGQPILFTCSITTSSPAPQLWIVYTPEVAGIASIKTGSYYIKTP